MQPVCTKGTLNVERHICEVKIETVPITEEEFQNLTADDLSNIVKVVEGTGSSFANFYKAFIVYIKRSNGLGLARIDKRLNGDGQKIIFSDSHINIIDIPVTNLYEPFQSFAGVRCIRNL